MMKTRSHSATTKEDRALALADESIGAPEVELTTMPATSGSRHKQENTVIELARHYFHLCTLTKSSVYLSLLLTQYI